MLPLDLVELYGHKPRIMVPEQPILIIFSAIIIG